MPQKPAITNPLVKRGDYGYSPMVIMGNINKNNDVCQKEYRYSVIFTQTSIRQRVPELADQDLQNKKKLLVSWISFSNETKPKNIK